MNIWWYAAAFFLCALCGLYADKKGRRGWVWFGISVIVSPIIAWPILLCLRDGVPAAQAEAKSQGPSVFVKVARTGAAILIGLVVIVGFANWLAGPTHTPSPGYSPAHVDGPELVQTQVQPVEPDQPPIEVSAAQLYSDYDANEVLADSKYKGRRLSVSGIVVGISKDFADDPYVKLAGKNEYQAVNAYFGKARNDELAKLRKGDSITVSPCLGKGMVVLSPILDCK